MADRLNDIRIVDPVLTELARGYTNADYIATALFPIVNVNKEAGKIPLFGKEAFKVFDTLRALRAKSNKIPVEARNTTSFSTDEHDAVYPADYREFDEDSIDLRAYATFRAEAAILLKHEYNSAVLASDLANYPTGNKETLSGTSQWTDKTNSTPITDIKDAKESVRGKIVKEPNTLVLGKKTFNALQDHPAFIERIKYSQLGVVTVELMKQMLGFANIVVGSAVYADEDETLHDIWSDIAILAYIPEARTNVQRSIFEPSFGYTLRKSGMPQVDTYPEEGGKIENIRSTDNLDVKIVGSDAGYLIYDCCA